MDDWGASNMTQLFRFRQNSLPRLDMHNTHTRQGASICFLPMLIQPHMLDLHGCDVVGMCTCVYTPIQILMKRPRYMAVPLICKHIRKHVLPCSGRILYT